MTPRSNPICPPLRPGLLLLAWFLVLCGLMQPLQARTVFYNPLIADGADPWVLQKDGLYYYMQTNGKDVSMRSSRTLTGLAAATERIIFQPSLSTIWAPEIHFLQGKWYLYYAADDGNNANHRMYVAESTSSDPFGSYTLKGKIGDQFTDRWAIDGTVLEQPDGSRYFIWSGWETLTPVDQDQNLYIARMSNPWTVTGARVRISTPTEPWEGFIQEGPQILRRDGKLFIVYSANASWQDNYCLGLLELRGTNLLSAASWLKHPAPLFTTYTNEVGAVFGPGHCTFARSPDSSEDWIIYHGAKRKGSGWDRSIRAQTFSWNTNGTPFFGKPVLTNTPLYIPAGDPPTLAQPPERGVAVMQILPGTGSINSNAFTLAREKGMLDRFTPMLETPPEMGEDYSVRIFGYLVPPVSGSYVFYSAADDRATVWLSRDRFPANKRLLMQSFSDASYREWETATAPTRESAAIELVANEFYYFEGYHREGFGGDHFGLQWRIPGQPVPVNGSQPINGQYLALDAALLPPKITNQPQGQIVGVQADTTLTTSASGATETLTYQWSYNGVPLAGSTNGLLGLGGTNKAGLYHARVRNDFGFDVTVGAPIAQLEVPSPGVMTLRGPPSYNYRVQFADAITSPMAWRLLANVTMGTNAYRSVDGFYKTRSQRYFRALALP